MAIKSEHHALHVSHVCADFATATRVGYTLPYTLRCAALHCTYHEDCKMNGSDKDFLFKVFRGPVKAMTSLESKIESEACN